MATAGEAGSGAADVVGYSRWALLGRIAQRESARFTRGRSLVRSQVRPPFSDVAQTTTGADTVPRELLERHHALIRRELVRFRGAELDVAGDGFFGRFDGPARAIRCACAITESVPELGLEIRAGLHTGECEVMDGKVGGIAVHIGARVAKEAQPGEVLVSSTVKDLVADSASASANADQ